MPASAFKVDGQAVEILQTQDRAVKVVRLLPPVGRDAVAFTNPGRAGIILKQVLCEWNKRPRRAARPRLAGNAAARTRGIDLRHKVAFHAL